MNYDCKKCQDTHILGTDEIGNIKWCGCIILGVSKEDKEIQNQDEAKNKNNVELGNYK